MINDSNPLLGETDREGEREEEGGGDKFKLRFFNKEELGMFDCIYTCQLRFCSSLVPRLLSLSNTERSVVTRL